MRVLIAGATGALGRPLVRELLHRGHDVVGLSRSDANDATLRELGARAVRGSLFDPADAARAAEGCDVVVRTATHIAARPKEADWRENDRIRRDGTRALLEAARKVGARYVQESIVWVARPDDGSPFDETSPVVPDRVVQSAIDAERMAAVSGVPSATLRLGWLRGGDTLQERMFQDMLRKRMLPVVGQGDAPLAYLHVDDAARAFAAAVERPVTGVFHVVDDEPTTLRTYLDALAARAGAPPPRRIPVWLGRLMLGPFVTKLLTTPMRTSAARLQRETGWRPLEPRPQ